MDASWLFLALPIVGAITIFGTIIAAFSRYKKCPADRILVISGRVGRDTEGNQRSAKCIHGGAAFVWPVIQEYKFLDLTPITIDVNLQDALSKQNIRISTPCTFTIGISTEPFVMQNAAERLLGLGHDEVKQIAQDIIFGQIRVVVATMDIETINANRDHFIQQVMDVVEVELKKVGLHVINVNVKDVTDKSGYLDALGKKAAAQAINDAKVQVAEKDRDGAVGEANAQREERIQVAEANARAVEGENTAKIDIANSNAARQVAEAEAKRLATAAEKVKAAGALEEAYAAERTAETARAERERATQTADIIVPQEISKRQVIIEAEAHAEQLTLQGRGEGQRIYNEMSGRASGILEVLSKQAEGLEKIVAAANGDPRAAAMLMIVDKLTEIVRLQVEAISGIKIDQVMVWDSMGGGNGTGTPATANFIAGMIKSVPPLQGLFEMAGMNLPTFLGTPVDKPTDALDAASKDQDPASEATDHGLKPQVDTD